MFIPSIPGDTASTVSAPAIPAPPASPSTAKEPVRHMLFGTLSAVQNTIRQLHKLNYAEPNDWSRPLSTGRPNEVMVILTKKVSAE